LIRSVYAQTELLRELAAVELLPAADDIIARLVALPQVKVKDSKGVVAMTMDLFGRIIPPITPANRRRSTRRTSMSP
jgi:hypothetical protein